MLEQVRLRRYGFVQRDVKNDFGQEKIIMLMYVAEYMLFQRGDLYERVFRFTGKRRGSADKKR